MLYFFNSIVSLSPLAFNPAGPWFTYCSLHRRHQPVLPNSFCHSLWCHILTHKMHNLHCTAVGRKCRQYEETTISTRAGSWGWVQDFHLGDSGLHPFWKPHQTLPEPNLTKVTYPLYDRIRHMGWESSWASRGRLGVSASNSKRVPCTPRSDTTGAWLKRQCVMSWNEKCFCHSAPQAVHYY